MWWLENYVGPSMRPRPEERRNPRGIVVEKSGRMSEHDMIADQVQRIERDIKKGLRPFDCDETTPPNVIWRIAKASVIALEKKRQDEGLADEDQ